jgi:Spy/CpxP family protein refolding chaperone
MAVARARVYAEVFQILTPEQQTKLKTLQTDMRERAARMHEQRGRR